MPSAGRGIWVRSEEIKFHRPPLESFLGEYNDLLAGILVRSFPSFKHLASPTLDRMEGQTHLYERLEKYLQLRERLSRDPALRLELVADEQALYPALRMEFGGRVRGADTFWSQALRFPLRFLWNLGFTLAASLVSALWGRPRGSYQSVVRTYFDFRCRDGAGRLREEYFGPFLPDLAQASRTLVVFKLVNKGDLGLYRRLRGKAGFDHCLLEAFLSPWAVLRVYLSYLFSRARLEEPCPYHGVDARPLIQRSLNEDYLNLRGLPAYLEREAARGILRPSVRRLYLPCENQAWEKAYPLVRREKDLSRLFIVGFQHTGLSYKLLNYFPSRLESSLPVFPDRIVTVGQVLARLLREEAHFPSEIVEGAALRHEKLVQDGTFRVRPPSPEVQRGVVYAFSYDLSKYRNILEALTAAFEGSPVMVYLKIHPLYKEEDVLRSSGLTLPPNFVPVQGLPWEEVYRQVDCVLYDDNSIGLEGLTQGLKTFMLDAGEPIYRCDRMFYFSEWEPTLDREGLFRLRRELEAGTFSKHFDVRRVSAYLKSYYNPYSSNRFKAYFNDDA